MLLIFFVLYTFKIGIIKYNNSNLMVKNRKIKPKTISAYGQCDLKYLHIRRQVDIKRYRSMQCKTTTSCRMSNSPLRSLMCG